MLIEFQTVKQLFLTTIGFQRRSHLHINVNEMSNNLHNLKTFSAVLHKHSINNTCQSSHGHSVIKWSINGYR
jgi:hypothetical protein